MAKNLKSALGKIDWVLLLKAAAVFAAGYLAVAPSLGGGWLWDDNQQVTANMALRNARGLWRIWFASMENDYYPLKSSVLWVLWHLWGPVPMGYRLFSLGCHLTSALLVWRLLKSVGLGWGWLGGLLFAAHPLAVESVAWISEIKNTLSLPFLLAAMLFYIDYDDTRRGRTLVAAILCFLAAMLCKSSVVMLPAVVLLYCWWKRGSISRRDVVSALPFAAISLVLGGVTIWFQNARAIGDNPIPELGFVARLAGAGANACFYLGKFLFPAGLSPIYPQWSLDPPALWQFLSVPALAVILWWCWLRRDSWGRHALLGLGFFLLNLLPVLGMLKISFMAFSWVSDHFVYLPMIGLIGLAVAGAEAACRRLPRIWQTAEYAAVGGLIAVLLTLSNAHAAIFGNKKAMWAATLRVNPDAFAAHNGLAIAYLDEDRLPEAFAHIQEALRIRPGYALARNHLGLALMKAGRSDEALVEFREAVRLDPNRPAPHNNMGNLFLVQKKLAEAESEFHRAITLDPYCTPAHNSLGIILALKGRRGEAIGKFQTALAIDPNYDEAHRNLGIVLAQEGRTDEALRELREALKINPGNTNARAILQTLQQQSVR